MWNATSWNLVAVGFGSPWLLFGLGGAAIPVVIHLLHKRRYREAPWAAMRFLAEAARKHSRRLRWEQFLLLLVRCLAVACIALALSRPFFDESTAADSGYEPRHLVFVIDDSYSMGYGGGDDSRLAEAIRSARDIVSNSRSGDGFSLLTLSGGRNAAVLEAPTFRPESILAELESVRLSERPADLSATLAKLASVLQEAPELANKEVVFFSDFQQRDWRPDSASRERVLQSRLSALGDGVRFSFYHVGRANSPNAAVTGLTISPRPVIANEPVQLTAELRAWGGFSLSGTAVDLVVDGKLVGTRSLADVNGTQTTVDFEHIWSTAGESRIELRFRSDRLDADNVFRQALRVRDAVRVLLVDGRASGAPRDRSTYYLETALRTGAVRRDGSPLIVPTVTDLLGVAELPFNRFDAIAVCNVPSLSPRLRGRFVSYLQSGGSVVVVLGDLADRRAWNDFFATDTLFPAPLLIDAEFLQPGGDADVVGFLQQDLDHPIVSAFRGNPGTGLETALIWDYWRVTEPAESSAEVVLRFVNGDPAIVDLPTRGGGTALVVTTSLDARWGSWAPLSSSFAPLATEMVLYSAGRRGDSTGVLVGEPLTGNLAAEHFATSLSVRDPAGEETIVEPVANAAEQGGLTWRYEPTERSGYYTVRFGAPLQETRDVAVNVDRAESDLVAVDERELRETLFRGRSLSFRELTGTTSAELRETLRAERSPWIDALLWTGLTLLGIEVLLAWRFPAGAVGLACGAILGAVLLLSRWYGTQIALASGMLLAALLLLVVVRSGIFHRLRRRT